jgi:hypothetical protein
MAEQNVIEILIRSVDQLSGDVQTIKTNLDSLKKTTDGANKSLEGTASATKSASDTLGVLSDVATVAGSAFQKFENSVLLVNKAFMALKAGAPIIALGATISALTSLGKKAAENGAELAKLSKVTGTSTEFLSALRVVAEDNDSTLQEFTNSIRFFQRNLSLAARSGGEARDAFTDMGLKDLLRDTGDTEAALVKFAKQFTTIKSSATQNEVAMRFFGKGGREVIQTLTAIGTEGIEPYRQKAKELGVLTDEFTAKQGKQFNDSLTTLKQTFEGVAYAIGNTVLPSMVSFVNTISEVIKENKTFITTLAAVTLAFTGGVGLIAAIRGVVLALDLLKTHPVIAALTVSITALSAAITYLKGQVNDVQLDNLTKENAPQKLTEVTNKITALKDEIAKLQEQASAPVAQQDFSKLTPEEATKQFKQFVQSGQSPASRLLIDKQLAEKRSRLAALEDVQKKINELLTPAGGKDKGEKEEFILGKSAADRQVQEFAKGLTRQLADLRTKLEKEGSILEVSLGTEGIDRAIKDFVEKFNQGVADGLKIGEGQFAAVRAKIVDAITRAANQKQRQEFKQAEEAEVKSILALTEALVGEEEQRLRILKEQNAPIELQLAQLGQLAQAQLATNAARQQELTTQRQELQETIDYLDQLGGDSAVTAIKISKIRTEINGINAELTKLRQAPTDIAAARVKEAAGILAQRSQDQKTGLEALITGDESRVQVLQHQLQVLQDQEAPLQTIINFTAELDKLELAILQKKIEQQRVDVEVAKARFQAGQISQQDLALAEAQLAKLEASKETIGDGVRKVMAQAQRDIRDASESLARDFANHFVELLDVNGQGGFKDAMLKFVQATGKTILVSLGQSLLEDLFAPQLENIKKQTGKTPTTVAGLLGEQLKIFLGFGKKEVQSPTPEDPIKAAARDLSNVATKDLTSSSEQLSNAATALLSAADSLRQAFPIASAKQGPAVTAEPSPAQPISSVTIENSGLALQAASTQLESVVSSSFSSAIELFRSASAALQSVAQQLMESLRTMFSIKPTTTEGSPEQSILSIDYKLPDRGVPGGRSGAGTRRSEEINPFTGEPYGAQVPQVSGLQAVSAREPTVIQSSVNLLNASAERLDAAAQGHIQAAEVLTTAGTSLVNAAELLSRSIPGSSAASSAESPLNVLKASIEKRQPEEQPPREVQLDEESGLYEYGQRETTITEVEGRLIDSMVTGSMKLEDMSSGAAAVARGLSGIGGDIGRIGGAIATFISVLSQIGNMLGSLMGSGGGGSSGGGFMSILSSIGSIFGSFFGGGAKEGMAVLGGYNNGKLPSALLDVMGVRRFAAGGMVQGPTLALLGEGGEDEYVIPKSKMGKKNEPNVKVEINGDITPRRPDMKPEDVVRIIVDNGERKGPIGDMIANVLRRNR